MRKRFIKKLVLFLLIAILLDQALGICLDVLTDRFSPGFGTRIQDFYGTKENVDMLFIGSSHAYRSFNPYLFDDVLYVNSFNLGSDGQTPFSTYYLLKEVFRIGHKPKMIALEAYWLGLSGTQTNSAAGSVVFRTMKLSENKLAMLRATFKFPSSLKIASRLFNNRSSIAYIAMALLGIRHDNYIGRGYVEDPTVISETALANNEFRGKKQPFNPLHLEYLGKVIELAKEHGAEVIVVTTPIAPTAFKDVEDYPELHQAIDKIASEYGIEYLDYNIINESQNLFTDKNFRDDDHLNKSGVEILDDHFAKHLVSKYGQHFQLTEN